MSTTLSRKDGALTWLMLTGMPSARRCKVMSKAMGCKKAAGGSEGKSLVGHKSSQGQKGRVL